MEIMAIWPKSSNRAASDFITKYKGCFTYIISERDAANVAGAPAGSSFELAEFWADASQPQIIGVTRKFEKSDLFTRVKYLRSLFCPGFTFQSFGYCVTNSGNEWAYEPSTG
jgi:hypothetical protein